MLAEELYDAGDPELLRRRVRARRLTRQFNASREDEACLRASLLAELLGGMGTGVLVEPLFYCDYGSQIRIGDHVAVNFNCVVLDCAAVRIGDHALLGPLVQIYTAEHPVDPVERRRDIESAAPVTIGAGTTVGGKRRGPEPPARRAGRGQPLSRRAAGRQYPVKTSRRTCSSGTPISPRAAVIASTMAGGPET